MDELRTVKQTSSAEFVEKKSVFIGYTTSVETEEDAKAFIQAVKKRHSDARHNCSAYVLANGIMHSSDDGEPSGTAGVPILEVIKKSEIVNVVVVVTRYFGGILLGAGGLLRAYSQAAKMAIEEATIVTYEKLSSCCIECQYNDYNDILYRLGQFKTLVTKTDYTDSVKVYFNVTNKQYDDVINEIKLRFEGKYDVKKIDEIFGII
ncbi:MAG: YigZ family protein [Clostridia bacterium]|nr:YigZ family protein [Clostridia bacterium]